MIGSIVGEAALGISWNPFNSSRSLVMLLSISAYIDFSVASSVTTAGSGPRDDGSWGGGA